MTNRTLLTTLVAVMFAAAAVAVADHQGAGSAALKNPAGLKETAPATYKANFETSVGSFVIEVHRDWAPQGADRFYNLVKNGYYDGARFFRVIPGFMVQFGINGDPAVNTAWRGARIPDDPVKQSNKRGYVTFAHGGPGTRTTQVFINFGDNGRLDAQGFPPFGQVTSGGMAVVEITTRVDDKEAVLTVADRGNGVPEGQLSLLTRPFYRLDSARSEAKGAGLGMSIVNRSLGERPAEGRAGIVDGYPGFVDNRSLLEEAVVHALVALEIGRDAGFLQAGGVGLALVAERVVFSGDHKGRRQAAEVFGLKRRGIGIETVFRSGQVMVPEPLHRVGRETILAVAVGDV